MACECSSNALLTERILFSFENNLPSQPFPLPITSTSKVENVRATKRMPDSNARRMSSKQRTTDHCLIHLNSLYRCCHRQYAYKVVSFEFAQYEIGVNNSWLMVTSRPTQYIQIRKITDKQTRRTQTSKQIEKEKANRKCIFHFLITNRREEDSRRRLPLEDSAVRTTCRLHPFEYQIDTAMQTNARLFFFESISYVSIRVEGGE